MEILKNFGVQPTLLFGQIVNFLVILFLLRKFFFGKIVQALDERKKKIEESLENADLIEKRLAETEEKSAKIIENSQKQAQVLIDQAKVESQNIANQAVTDARATMEETIKSAQNQIQAQKEQMQKELQEETLTLISAVVEKVLGKNLKNTQKEALTKQAIGELSQKIS